MDRTSDTWFKEMFIDEAKAALDSRINAGGGGDYDEGVEAGKQAEYDKFWDAYQENGNRYDYAYGFYNLGWTDDSFMPKYDIKMRLNNYAAFCWSKIIDTKRTIDITAATNITNLFAWCAKLKTIRKLVVSETTPFNRGVFQACSALENITIEGLIGVSIAFTDSPLLTTDSVQSIINSLKDLTGATAQTLTFHSDVKAKLTEEQIQQVWDKNWTLG